MRHYRHYWGGRNHFNDYIHHRRRDKGLLDGSTFQTQTEISHIWNPGPTNELNLKSGIRPSDSGKDGIERHEQRLKELKKALNIDASETGIVLQHCPRGGELTEEVG